MLTEWWKDPEGNEYRIDTELRSVEYKKKVLPEPTNFKPFLVKVRGEIWHVMAADEEEIAKLFWSDSLPHLPKRNEVVCEEIK